MCVCVCVCVCVIRVSCVFVSVASCVVRRVVGWVVFVVVRRCVLFVSCLRVSSSWGAFSLAPVSPVPWMISLEMLFH